MTEEKQKLQYVTLTYVGREYRRTFVNDDKSETKSYKYMFKEKESDMYSRNFWGYDTTKGAKSLEEGKEAVIGFVERENKQGDKPIKVARFFGEPQGEQQTKVTTGATEEDEGASIPESLKGEWLNNLKENKDEFIKAFVEEQSGFEDFCVWLDNEKACETDVFIKAREYVGKEGLVTLKKTFYNGLLQELDVTI